MNQRILADDNVLIPVQNEKDRWKNMFNLPSKKSDNPKAVTVDCGCVYRQGDVTVTITADGDWVHLEDGKGTEIRMSVKIREKPLISLRINGREYKLSPNPESVGDGKLLWALSENEWFACRGDKTDTQGQFEILWTKISGRTY